MKRGLFSLWALFLSGICALSACGGTPTPEHSEDAGEQVRIAPGGSIQRPTPNCVLDIQCSLVVETCPCRCRLNTEATGLKFPNVICIALACEPCVERVAFCDYPSFTCQMR